MPRLSANCGNFNFQHNLENFTSYIAQNDLLEDVPKKENLTALVNKGYSLHIIN